jgi:hypothetical protein
VPASDGKYITEFMLFVLRWHRCHVAGSGGLFLMEDVRTKRILKASVIVLEAEKKPMDQNTAVGKLATGGDPQQLSREIMAALAEAGKFGYDAIFDEPGGQADELTIMFTRLSAKQVLIIPGWVWRHRGGVRQAVIDQLTI